MKQTATWVIASNNQGKTAEIRDLLYDWISTALHCPSLADYALPSPQENGLTFVENALIKARYAASKTGLPAIADDSGLIVPYLGGKPGIHSARYAGEQASDAENNSQLLAAMAHSTPEQRQAHFHSAMVFVRHAKDPSPLIGEGQWEGEIVLIAQGEKGFGYDPLFYVPTMGCTAACLQPHTRNRINHRAMALKSCLRPLKALVTHAGVS